MLHTVGELKAGVQAILQNIPLNKVVNLNGAIERAARTVVQQADVPEASGVEPITLYDGVYYYLAPETIFGGAINLIRRQGEASSPLDYNYKVPTERFTRNKQLLPNGYMMDLEYMNGTALLGISSPIPKPKIVLDPMSSTDGWTLSGTANSLRTDYTSYFQQPASLRFNLVGNGTAHLSKTLQSPVQMEAYEGVGVAFLAIQIPETPELLTNISVSLGSGQFDVDTVSVNKGFLGAWVSGTWLLVAFDFAKATRSGVPDWNNIDYLRVSLTHSGGMVNMRTGYLFISLPSPQEILFQSSAIFKAQNGDPKQTITTDGDTVILNDAAYQLFEYEASIAVALQQGGDLASGEIQTLRALLYGSQNDVGLYNLYRADNPSQELRTVGSWYDPWGNSTGTGGR